MRASRSVTGEKRGAHGNRHTEGRPKGPRKAARLCGERMRKVAPAGAFRSATAPSGRLLARRWRRNSARPFLRRVFRQPELPGRGKRRSPGGCALERTLLTTCLPTISCAVEVNISCIPARKSGKAAFSTVSAGGPSRRSGASGWFVRKEEKRGFVHNFPFFIRNNYGILVS